MTQWEYRVEFLPPGTIWFQLMARLGEMGKDGWELAALDIGKGDMILKRPIPQFGTTRSWFGSQEKPPEPPDQRQGFSPVIDAIMKDPEKV